MASTDIQYSKYYSELEGEAKSRYEQKVQMIGLVDPYCRLESRGTSKGTSTSNSSSSVDWYEWPEVTHADIYSFLINTTSYCMHEQLKAYKSLDGYNLCLAAPPLKVWVATKQQGEVLCTHCSCMASLGEACSHIVALLFAAETNTA